jgi:uncharacterized protein (UPF0305 family)
VQELARAARSAEKFFDTLSRELPPTLQAIRDTSLEITDLTDDVSEGVKSASQVVKQVDQSLDSAKKQAKDIQISSRSLVVGIKTAWKTFTRRKPARPTSDRLPMKNTPELRQKIEPQQTRFYSGNNIYSEAVNWETDFDDK